jgi:hypothetical protein
MTTTTGVDLTGVDCRRPRWRRETFLRFYRFHLAHGTHPGCVHHLLPGLAAAEQWSREQVAWCALLNGHTQNPVTTWLLMRAAPEPAAWPHAAALLARQWRRLAWDTDRRHQKAALGGALLTLDDRGVLDDLVGWWEAPDNWPAMWAAATALPSFGRLSAWSFIEYGWLLGLHPHDADTLMLHDEQGSRSHRLGLAWVGGLNAYDPHPTNPERLPGAAWPPGLTDQLADLGESLLDEARARWPHLHPSRLSLESALCTYKGWHRPRRRYPNVYADMAHDRIRAAEAAWPDVDFGPFWAVRAVALPAPLRLEACPLDPGMVPAKQDWYRLTGRPPMIEADDPQLASGWPEHIADGHLTHQRRWR